MYSSWAGSVGREVESVLKDDLIRADVETDVQERSMSIECSGSQISKVFKATNPTSPAAPNSMPTMEGAKNPLAELAAAVVVTYT